MIASNTPVLSLVSLGCPKNLVDSEVILARLATDGFLIAREPADADLVLVNTCGFLSEAREESMATIEEMLRLKAQGTVRAVLVAGCLVSRVGEGPLRERLSDVDAWLPLSDYSEIHKVARRVLARSPGTDHGFRGGGPVRGPEQDSERLLLTPRSYAYLRIAEGCANKCSFCIIPRIRGTVVRSKPLDVLRREAEGLAAGGVPEVVLIAEDTTAYGRDLWGRLSLDRLLRELARVDGIEWIRVLYTYPSFYTPELIEEIASNPKVVRYLDVPIQHVTDRMLRAMRRGTRRRDIEALVARLRERIPGIALRTTLIVGFPGETEEDFEELLRFVEETRFDRLGVFRYSREPGTPASDLPDPVSPEVAQERLDRVMRLQQALLFAENASRLGSRDRVLVDGRSVEEPGMIEGRTFRDAPEIDCRVLVPEGEEKVQAGDFLDVEVVATRGYDLVGRAMATGRSGLAAPSRS